jgi:hypothetical protein
MPPLSRHAAAAPPPPSRHGRAVTVAPPQRMPHSPLAPLTRAARPRPATAQDPCCFHGCNRHDRIREYNTFVKSQVSGLFQTCITTGNAHEINPRDKVVIGSLLDKLRIAGTLSAADVDELPFNSLREW